MTINKLNCEANFKSAAITLNYDELRDIANGLYELSKLDVERSADFHKIHRDMTFLFDIVKNGCIDGFSVRQLTQLHEKFDSSRKARAMEREDGNN